MYTRSRYRVEKILLASAALIILAPLLGCAGPTASSPPAPTATPPVPLLANVETFRSYDASANEHPEGIAVDRDGNVYASLARLGQVRKISPDGSESIIFDSGEPKLLGLVVDSERNLFCCQHSPGASIHGVYRIDVDGASERLRGTEAIVHPNGLALDLHGNLYVSDSQLGAVWRVPAGGVAELWLQHDMLEGTDETPGYPPLGANGMAHWDDSIYVANLEKGHVVRIRILEDGNAAAPAIVAEGRYGLDGIAVDGYGRIFAALGVQSKIVWIDPANAEFTELAVRADGLDIPASLAFGTTNEDQDSLYVTNYAVSIGSTHPGILRLEIGVRGPPLP